MEVSSAIISAISQLIFFSLIPFIWWHKTSRKEDKFLDWIGLKKPVIKESKLKLILITLIISAGYIFLTSIIINTFMKSSDMATNQFYKKGLSVLPSILFYSVIQTALSEEILFRGFLGKRFINKFGFIKFVKVNNILYEKTNIYIYINFWSDIYVKVFYKRKRR